MAYTRLNPKPKGYDTAHQVNLLDYSSSNMFTVPSGGGVVRIECNYRANAWSRAYIYTGSASTSAQSAQSSSAGAGGTSQIIQVYEGQRLYGEINSAVPYGSVAFLPYTY